MKNDPGKVFKLFGTAFLLLSLETLTAQSLTFGPEIPVTINGYSLDAMEPALSADGNVLFFNSLNDGVTTSLFYAGRANDSTFNLVGQVPAVNQTVTPRLDGVASIDSLNNYYWVSTRGYPSNPYNLHRIRFLTSSYTNFGRVYGDFYNIGPGWIVMDASITFAGDRLLYCNAKFNNCTLNTPCVSTIGMAQKVNDSTFSKMSDSDQIFAAVNDTTDYAVYAPHLSKNGLELYYSRLHKAALKTDVVVALRPNLSSPFLFHKIIDNDTLSEAPVLNTESVKLYYHKKTGGRFNLVLRYRADDTGLTEENKHESLNVSPNPTTGFIKNLEGKPFRIYNALGEMFGNSIDGQMDLSHLSPGLYIVSDPERRVFCKIVKL